MTIYHKMNPPAIISNLFLRDHPKNVTHFHKYETNIGQWMQGLYEKVLLCTLSVTLNFRTFHSKLLSLSRSTHQLNKYMCAKCSNCTSILAENLAIYSMLNLTSKRKTCTDIHITILFWGNFCYQLGEGFRNQCEG